jgi:SAM-dependent methyltransferase
MYPVEQFENYLIRKPFSDQRRGGLLKWMPGRLLRHLPQPTARLLDIGVGSGWTSKIFALTGYDVVGVDIAPSLIELERRNCDGLANVEFYVADYERKMSLGAFDCAIIYDALHHSIDEQNAITSIYNALRHGGELVTIEPGSGHPQTSGAIDAVAKFGKTEKRHAIRAAKIVPIRIRASW